MFGLRGSELLIILLVVVILFGSTRLPQLGSSMGEAIRNFKKGFQGEDTPQDKSPQALAASGQVESKDPASTASTHKS